MTFATKLIRRITDLVDWKTVPVGSSIRKGDDGSVEAVDIYSRDAVDAAINTAIDNTNVKRLMVETSGDPSSVLDPTEILYCVPEDSLEGFTTHQQGEFFVNTHPHPFGSGLSLFWGYFQNQMRSSLNESQREREYPSLPEDLPPDTRQGMVLVHRQFGQSTRVQSYVYSLANPEFNQKVSKYTYQELIGLGQSGLFSVNNYIYNGGIHNPYGQTCQIDSVYFDDDNLYIRQKALKSNATPGYIFRVQPVY